MGANINTRQNTFCLIILFALIMQVINPVNGATKNWTGNSSSNWNTAANWSGGTLPVNGDNIVINPTNYTGSAISPVISTASSFSPLNIDVLNGGVLTIQANITTTGIITIDGNTGTSTVNMSAGTITMNGSNKQFVFTNGAVCNFTGGTITTNYELHVYYGAQFNMSGTAILNVTTKLLIKGKKTTTHSLFNMTAGTTTVTGVVEIDGVSSASFPKLNVSGGTFTANSTIEFKGNTTDRSLLTISGGTLTSNGEVFNTANSYMDMSISGGTMVCKNALTIRNNADTIRQSGGVLRFDNSYTWTLSGAYVCIGGEVIFNGFTSFSSGNSNFQFNNLTINSGKTLEMGGSINSIKVSGNWYNDGGTFTHNNKPVIFNGNSSQTITKTTGTQTFYDVVINNTSSVNPSIILGGNVIINNGLTMTKGNVNLNNLTLTLGVSAASVGTLTYTDGYFYGGSFKRWFNTSTIADGNSKGFFPMGGGDSLSSVNNWSRGPVSRPLYISYPTTAPTTGGTINVVHSDSVSTTSISFSDDVPLEVRSNSNWQITTSGIVGGTYNLNAGGGGFYNSDINDLRLTLANSVVGTKGTNAGTTTVPQVKRTGLSLTNINNSFFVSSISLANSPLPVSWISFIVEQDGNDASISWSTASEINNNFFTIEKTKNFNQIETVSLVPGSGNSNEINRYKYFDINAYEGISYYRIKQTDYDGRQDSLPWKSFTHKASFDLFSFHLFPNPIKENQTLQLKFEGELNNEVLILVLDVFGREYFSKVVLLDANNPNIAIDLQNRLKEGIYFVTGSAKDILFSKKLVVRNMF